MTKKEMFECIDMFFPTENENREIIHEFCLHEIALLSKKNSARVSKKSKDNEVLANEILNILDACGKPLTVTEIIKNGNLPYSTQKVTPILRQLVETEEVTKTVEKRISKYSKV